MSKGAMMFDLKDFDAKFNNIVENAIPSLAAALCIRDAVKVQPTVPKKSGTLRDSYRIERPETGHGEIGVRFGFNTKYAARLHEAPSNWNWSLAGSGPKYLETKMAQFREKYMKHCADYILSKQGKPPMEPPPETESGPKDGGE